MNKVNRTKTHMYPANIKTYLDVTVYIINITAVHCTYIITNKHTTNVCLETQLYGTDLHNNLNEPRYTAHEFSISWNIWCHYILIFWKFQTEKHFSKVGKFHVDFFSDFYTEILPVIGIFPILGVNFRPSWKCSHNSGKFKLSEFSDFRWEAYHQNQKPTIFSSVFEKCLILGGSDFQRIH